MTSAITDGQALEGTHALPDGAPLWSENYAWTCYDPASRAGVLLHLGRMPHQRHLLRSTVVAYLPEGRLAVWKAVAPRAGEAIGNGNLTLTCERPLQRWTLRYDGVARAVDRHALAGGRLTDQDVIGLRIELTFEHLAPIWNLGAMMDLGETHYEQFGRYSGTIVVGDTTHDIDTAGYRDHSTGKRDLAGFGGHVWTHAYFPSGRAFTAFRAYTPDGTIGLNDGIVLTGGELVATAPLQVPALHDTLGGPEEVTIAMPGAAPISGRVVHGVPISLGEPNDFHLGADLGVGRKVMLDCPTRFEWDGETAYGWLERSTVLH
jgi:hypothetical protein